jgi:iron(III) transport system substrate-binding protein
MPGITRRGLGTGLAATVAAHRADADPAGLEVAARAEGTVTWYVAQMSGEAAEAMARRFTQRYPGIGVSAIRTTGQVAYERLQQELKNNTPTCDVFSSTDISHYPALIKRNALAHYEPANASELAKPYQGLGLRWSHNRESIFESPIRAFSQKRLVAPVHRSSARAQRSVVQL